MSRPYCYREPEEQCGNCKVLQVKSSFSYSKQTLVELRILLTSGYIYLQLVKKQLEHESAKGHDYREKLRDTRTELTSKDRQLEVARRMLAKVNAEKSNLEVMGSTQFVYL